jgi:hypothetical protein
MAFNGFINADFLVLFIMFVWNDFMPFSTYLKDLEETGVFLTYLLHGAG